MQPTPVWLNREGRQPRVLLVRIRRWRPGWRDDQMPIAVAPKLCVAVFRRLYSEQRGTGASVLDAYVALCRCVKQLSVLPTTAALRSLQQFLVQQWVSW